MDQTKDFEADRRKVQRIVAGSQADWHDFIDRYTPLIRSVLRRYVHDEETIADLWTSVLERLQGGLLARFEGRSTLATWLVFVVRSTALDHLRRQRGRRRLPPALQTWPAHYRLIYEQVFIQGRSLDEVRQRLRSQGLLPDGTSLAEVLAEIEDLLGDHTLQRIAWDLQADQVGAVSGRLLEYLDQAARDAERGQHELSPERQLLQAEARQTLERVQALVDGLPELERQVVDLRFGQGRKAGEIAQVLHLRDQREVYTITERALRTLRKLLGLSSLLAWWIFLAGSW